METDKKREARQIFRKKLMEKPSTDGDNTLTIRQKSIYFSLGVSSASLVAAITALIVQLLR